MEENRNESDRMEIEISLRDLFSIFVKNLWIIAICALLCGTAVYIYNSRYVVPIYQSEVRFYITPINTSALGGDVTDAQILALQAQSLAYAKQIQNTYLQILQGPTFKTKLGNDYLTSYGKEMDGEFTVLGITDTQLFKIQVTSSSKEDAYNIAKQIEKTTPVAISAITDDSGGISVADEATEPDAPVNNNTVRNTLIGVILGALVIYGIGFLIFMFDRRVKDEEDLKNHYNVPILGGIVDFSKANKAKGQY